MMGSISIKAMTLSSRLAATGYQYAAKALRKDPVQPTSPPPLSISNNVICDGTASPSSSSSSSTPKPRRGLLSRIKRVFKGSKDASPRVAAGDHARPMDSLTGRATQLKTVSKSASRATVSRYGDSTFITKAPAPGVKYQDKNANHVHSPPVDSSESACTDRKDAMIESLNLELKECIQLRKKQQLEHEETIAALKQHHASELTEKTASLSRQHVEHQETITALKQQHAQETTETTASLAQQYVQQLEDSEARTKALEQRMARYKRNNARLRNTAQFYYDGHKKIFDQHQKLRFKNMELREQLYLLTTLNESTRSERESHSWKVVNQLYATQKILKEEIEGLKEERDTIVNEKVVAVSESEWLQERNEVLEQLCESLEERDSAKKSETESKAQKSTAHTDSSTQTSSAPPSETPANPSSTQTSATYTPRTSSRTSPEISDDEPFPSPASTLLALSLDSRTIISQRHYIASLEHQLHDLCSQLHSLHTHAAHMDTEYLLLQHQNQALHHTIAQLEAEMQTLESQAWDMLCSRDARIQALEDSLRTQAQTRQAPLHEQEPRRNDPRIQTRLISQPEDGPAAAARRKSQNQNQNQQAGEEEDDDDDGGVGLLEGTLVD